MCAATETRQRGVTLVEVVMFILIIGIAVSSIVGTLAWASARSGEPVMQRQALAAAESILNEVLAQPFGNDDPDGGPESIGPEPGESRGHATTPFDHVNDYHGYTADGIRDAHGVPIAGLAAYSVAVTVQVQALDGVPATEGLLVRVQVDGPGGVQVALSGFRARTSP